MVQKKLAFREDINGLRAIAVIAVVLFHFSPGKLPGGFAGVDVFFVISGYLMTSIIFRGIEGGNFSFWRFAISRAKRILPALLAVSLLLLVFGYATLSPDAYKMLARHIRDSLLFVSNITYEKESGYFDAASNTKFLLHTWSLSVEWQFYIIYPIVLLVLKRLFSISGLRIAVIVMLIGSLMASIYITRINPDKAYFMFYTRSWEMLIGGIAFLYPLNLKSDRFRFVMEAIGLGLIAVAIVKIKTTTPWPGYMALLPVVGTYICIAANNNKTILSGFIIGSVGLWSYSIYLVHWPVLVFNHVLGWGLSFQKYIVVVFVLSFLLFQLVEKRRKYSWGLLVLFILALLMAVYVCNTNGVESRFDGVSKKPIQSGYSYITPEEWVIFNPSDTPYDYVFYGDSFNGQYSHFISQRQDHIGMLYRPECLGTPNWYSHREICKDQYSQLLEELNSKTASTLVISQAWSWANKGLRDRETDQELRYSIEQFIDNFEKEVSIMREELSVGKVVLIGIQNHFKGAGGPEKCLADLHGTTIYDSFFGKKDCATAPLDQSDYVEGFNKSLSMLAKKVDWIYFINPNDALCKDNKCMQIQDKQSLYVDKSHLSEIGAKIAGEYIFDRLEKISNGSEK